MPGKPEVRWPAVSNELRLNRVTKSTVTTCPRGQVAWSNQTSGFEWRIRTANRLKGEISEVAIERSPGDAVERNFSVGSEMAQRARSRGALPGPNT